MIDLKLEFQFKIENDIRCTCKKYQIFNYFILLWWIYHSSWTWNSSQTIFFKHLHNEIFFNKHSFFTLKNDNPQRHDLRDVARSIIELETF